MRACGASLLAAAGLLHALLQAPAAPAQAPARWVSRGPGGGGAFFAPAFDPASPGALWVSSDMGDAFRSADAGASWDTVDFRQLQGGNLMYPVQFTSDPRVRYALSGRTPARSADGGATWSPVPLDEWSLESFSLAADPSTTNRLLISDYTTLYFSTNGGGAYSAKFTAPDLHVAGVFFDGADIFVGTRAGLLVSTNGGGAFALSPAAGIPGTEAIVSFAGARQGSARRLFCVTLGSGDVYPSVTGADYGGYRGVYRLEPGPGAAWVRCTNGLGANLPFFVAMAAGDIDTAWLAGATDYPNYPVVFRTVDGGAHWVRSLSVDGNANVRTGWSGDDPGAWNWRKWSYGECALGLAVCASDASRAAITDYGFVHVTTNGGASWYAAYVAAPDLNPTNAATDKTKPYHGVGLENTACWGLAWPDADRIFACCTDLRGMLSAQGGRTWSFPATLTYNSTYEAVWHPAHALLYAAASSVHDLYAWDRYLQDSSIDGGSGEVIFSADRGAAWQRLHFFGMPVVGLAADPARTNRLYACAVHSVSGGIFRTLNLSAGAASTWTRLAVPPRTQGHPYVVRALNDGTLVCSYSGRIASGDFTASSGVFVSTDDGASWADRTATGMRYYTKDVLIDPHDPAQNRWYAGVWGEWGSSAGLGGLYTTTNRGAAWTRITTNLDQVGSCAISPWDPEEMYVTTENQGLWWSTNRRASNPAFLAVTNYPFKHPTRVFYNPFNSNEVWIASYGNGLRLGRRVEPVPSIGSLRRDAAGGFQLDLSGASGQRLETAAAGSAAGPWSPLSTNSILDDTAGMIDPQISLSSNRFYRLRVLR